MGVFVPYAVVLPNSKYQVVSRPFGLTVPFSCAWDGPTSVAFEIVTVGGKATVAPVAALAVVARSTAADVAVMRTTHLIACNGTTLRLGHDRLAVRIL